MAARQHKDFWGWASDHWFLTFLLASSALSAPYYLLQLNKMPPGTTPFPNQPK